MLALGWFSVESVCGAEKHPHRVRGVGPGQSLTPELAEQLLSDILRAHKGVSDPPDQADWVGDCALALTANIRHDAVIVNRAAAFAEWQSSVGDVSSEMPEQARRILFAMCGDGFASLALPNEGDATQGEVEAGMGTSDPASEEAAASQHDADEAAEPSNASRGVFGDLFGGDATKKWSRAAGKGEFAVSVRTMLTDLGGAPPTPETIIGFRKQQDLPELETSRPDKYPGEVSSSGAPTAVAKRYRKLLVCLNLWPASAEENGIPRTSAVSRHSTKATGQDERSRYAQINSLDLIDACQAMAENDDESNPGSASQRVFTPRWATHLAERVAAATDMPQDAKPLNEFKRLMFALAARRISQTQTWTKRNEVERHKAAVKEDTAKKELEKIDSDGRARAWLVAYEEKRAGVSGSASGFRVTRRMIGECEAVLKAWKGTATDHERIQQTATVQKAAEKFGDPALYADLSGDPAASMIWQHEEGAEILKQWVRLRQAQHDQQRLKIPRFCHPDPFRHPTWCEFGGSSKPKVWYAWKSDTTPQKPEAGGEADGSRRMWMLLPDVAAKQARPVPVRWRSKRLSNDLGGVRDVVETGIPRADRLSIAAANLPLRDANGRRIRYRPAHPFTKDAKGWNARLQVSRDTLERLEKQWDCERGDWRDNGKALRYTRWFVTFAPALAVSQSLGHRIHPKLSSIPNSNPHGEVDKKQGREGQAKLGLCRLPGLRVLSVDLGHRYAAACAVWEVMTTAQVEAACRAAGAAQLGESDLYLHLRTKDSKGRQRTTIYRRIASETVTDLKSGVVTPHPGLWARLERQFLVKLPGEEAPARKASPAEIDAVRRVEESLDRVRSTEERLPARVDELLSTSVDSARLALRRHGDAARIAYAFKPDAERLTPGGGREALSAEGRQAMILDALLLWHGLWSGDRWVDAWARQQWDAHVKPLRALDLPAWTDDSGESRRQHRGAIEDLLKPVAAALAARDGAGLHALWAERWRERDASWRGKAGHLRTLRSLLLPRGPVASTPAAWNVGGLSLTRIATLKSLYQLHKAFHMRPEPEDPRKNVPAKGEDELRDFGRRILNAMERLRDQRVKQIASRLVEASLGVGRHKVIRGIDPATGKPRRDRKRPQAQTDPPCHAVVIENLTNYRPEETRTRRENRQLMSWSSSKVKKHLSEACQLHGLHLREVQAGYTSRQDSRTGAPGIRCADVPVRDFLTKPWWRRQVKSAAEKVKQGKGDARERFLADLDAKWSVATEPARSESPPLRIPVNGGELFVSADPRSPAAKGLQADLNAAANIGLKALLDPDWPGKWWFVPCDTATYKPNPEKTKGSAAIHPGIALIAQPESDSESPAPKRSKKADTASPAKREREIVNLWRDPSHMPVAPGAAPQGWEPTPEYFRKVAYRTIQTLRRRAGLQADSH